jgi:hypothetical protein
MCRDAFEVVDSLILIARDEAIDPLFTPSTRKTLSDDAA